MNTGLRSSLSTGLFQAGLVCALLLVPIVTQEQTFYGSGGTTNTATSENNVALGFSALGLITTGSFNTATGYNALYTNTSGVQNTANGADALYYNSEGSYNTANGVTALYFNTSGYQNTATGWAALYSNTTGTYNTANGYGALYSNTVGYKNAADGYQALYYNTGGFANTAAGDYALYHNTTGAYNTADGIFALYNNHTGFYNSALGYGAGQNLTGNNNIAIGNAGVAGESGVIRIGTAGTHNAAYLAGVNGVNVGNGVAVYINANGRLGTILSSRRFKQDIQDMGNASDHLMQLRPVTFRYNDTAEKGPHTLQYGLIAEEAAKVYPNLVQYDKAGKPFTVYYHLLTPMLLNELQKAHQQMQTQKLEIASLKAAHKAEITAMKATLQQQRVELAQLKQAQAQQRTALTKLTALVEASQSKATQQRAFAMQH